MPVVCFLDFCADRKAMADAGELEGLDKVVAWVKNIYIFGLFEGETGEEAPWYLKPVSRRGGGGGVRCA